MNSESVGAPPLLPCLRTARRAGAGLSLLAALLFWLPSPAGAQSGKPAPENTGKAEVDLELILAVDVSYSVDSEEAKLQRMGYVEAIAHPSVVAAIQSGLLGRIAVTYVEWADDDYQNQLIGWTVISDAASARAFADRLTREPIHTELYTAIGDALLYGAARIADSPYQSPRKVIDISGDGASNEGHWLSQSREYVLSQGITINGLPIINDRPQPGGMATPRQMKLDEYYRNEVIGGPGAFIVIAEGFDDFRAAILNKLIREIAGRQDSDKWAALNRPGGRPPDPAAQ